MNRDEFLNSLSKLIEEYEINHNNNLIVGCEIIFMDNEDTFSFNGERFIKDMQKKHSKKEKGFEMKKRLNERFWMMMWSIDNWNHTHLEEFCIIMESFRWLVL